MTAADNEVTNDTADPELFDGPAKLTEFVKEAALRRTGNKNVIPCIFTIYTSGAMHNVTSPTQTGVWGAVRSLAVEVGDTCAIDFRLLDVATKEDLRFTSSVQAMRERELCVHNGRLFTSRLINVRESMPTVNVGSDDPSSFRLVTNNSGLLSDLEFRMEELPPLQPNEIEVSVKAAALNFRDIMIGLGRLPLLSFEASMLGRTVGMECCGEVSRIGSDVKDHKIGDKVLAMQGGCIANRLNCHEKAAYPLPTTLSFEEGSATASVYVTAYYALVYLAKMKEGQTILVHSALGGVGQAAIALAKLYGAKVYGTAGSEAKRDSLRDMGCIDAFNSHSTRWYSDLMTATNNRGVDIVLNSLAGEHVDLCLEALAPGGFHCEIGKVDIFADRPMKMSVFRKNIAFRAIDVDRLMTDDPYLTRELSKTVLDLMESKQVPPLPCTVFSYADYHDALRCMMNGQHRGKLVLTPPAAGESLRVVDDRMIYGCGKDGSSRTVLMSGCLGGFGLRVVAYVVAMGARNVVLMDRDPERRRDVEWVLDNSYISFLLGKVVDLRIEILYGDVGVYEHVTNVVDQVKSLGMPPIGSVFHLAGVLDDKKVEDIDRESYAKVFQPKANGAWNLHRATLDCPTIDHFVMFSSTSSAFGNHGQTNYSAANSYQDGLAAMRLQQGLPALSFCMGAVIEAGMASRSNQLLQMMKAGGMPAISCIFAIEALDSAIRDGKQWNSVAAIAKDLPANFESSDYLRTAAQLIRNNSAFKMGDNSSLSREALIELLSERVGKLCGVEKLDPTEPFSSYGLNSISVAELLTYLKNEMSYNVTAMELMTSATCESLADGIIQASQEKNEEVDNKDTDDGTAATGPESDSGTVATDEDDQVWSAPLVRRQSNFAPPIQEYFLYPPSPQIRGYVEQDITSFVKVDSGKVEKELNSVADPLGNLELGTLDGKLPQICEEQLSDLTLFLDSLDVSNVKEAVPVQHIRRVLVTGATGFVGRHFIADLLNNESHYIERIYCPIRANDDTIAFNRLVDAMTECGTWNENFRDRLHIFSGDLANESMGLSMESYKEVTDSIDAVYHFASNLNLTASFKDLRVSNCEPMRTVLHLCLQGLKRKHLFLASTMGIFPQYFCQFSNEYSDKAVTHNAMPQMTHMKKIFPLSMAGYPWSKLINELISYRAKKTKGLKLAVFRLPNMFTNSRTGYSVDGEPFVRFFFASLQMRKIISEERPPNFAEDSAPSNEMMLRISLNPNRKHTIYHCSYTSETIPTESSMNDMTGYKCEKTSYEKFKSQCMKLGKASPVNDYWLLLDNFSQYLFNYTKYAEIPPIDISAVEDDCYPMPLKSNSLSVFCKSLDWASKQTHSFLDLSLLKPATDLESVLSPSRSLCAKYKMDFDAVVKPYVVAGLERILTELHSRDAVLPEIVLSLTMRLEARVHLHRLVQLHPEICTQRIDSPLFILGLNRTGTTFLHRMMETSGCFEAPHPEDQLALPPVEKILHSDEIYAKNRLSAIASFLQGYADAADGIHDVELGVAEEDMVAHACTFMSLEYDVLYDLPNYRDWLETQDLEVVYEEHKTWMQFIAWWRQRQNPNSGNRWCYKFPWHLRSLKPLLKVYPDAKLVHTHRNIQDVASSWCSLVKGQRSRFVDDIDVLQLGKDELKSLSTTLQAGIDFRKDHPEHESKWLDVHYNDIITSPSKVAHKVINHAGLDVTEEAARKINLFIKQSLDKRDKMTFHKPKYQDYGITAKEFDTEVFTKYNKSSIGSVVSQLLTPQVFRITISTDQLLLMGAAATAVVAAAALFSWPSA